MHHCEIRISDKTLSLGLTRTICVVQPPPSAEGLNTSVACTTFAADGPERRPKHWRDGSHGPKRHTTPTTAAQPSQHHSSGPEAAATGGARDGRPRHSRILRMASGELIDVDGRTAVFFGGGADSRRAVLSGAFTPLEKYLDNPSERWHSLFTCCFSPDPAKRPQSASRVFPIARGKLCITRQICVRRGRFG